MKILYATTNQGKLKEVKEALQGFNIEVYCLSDFPDKISKSFEVQETGKTFSLKLRK